MYQFNDVIQKVREIDESILIDIPILRINSFVNEKKLEKDNLNYIFIEENQIWLWCECLNNDIHINSTFDVIFPYHDINNYQRKMSSLKHISINAHRNTNTFYKGSCGIGLIEFDGGVDNNIMCKIRQENTIYTSQNEVYFLTEEKHIFNILSIISRGNE